jgi:Protein of unknown function (DUF2384)
MDVKELISRLQDFDAEAEVFVSSGLKDSSELCHVILITGCPNREAAQLVVGSEPEFARIVCRTELELLRQRFDRDVETLNEGVKTDSLLGRAYLALVQMLQGDHDEAVRWFLTPCDLLSGERPIDTARTEVGAEEVLDVAQHHGQLRYGYYRTPRQPRLLKP